MVSALFFLWGKFIYLNLQFKERFSLNMEGGALSFLIMVSFLLTAVLLYICLLSHSDTEENCKIPY